MNNAMPEPALAPDCERAAQLLPDLWQDQLAAPDRAWLDRHLATCADCAELAAMWRDLGRLPEAAPGPLQRRRLLDLLATADRSPWHLRLADWRPRWGSLALTGWMLAVGLGGLGAGWWLRARESAAAAGDMAALRDEVRATRQMVALSLLQQQSANQRLEGVSYTDRLGALSPAVEAALLDSLRDDPSPDVRLAALDALQRAGGTHPSQQMTGSLVDAFASQQSPLLQVAMVDSFVALRPPQARPLLRKVSLDPSYAPEVRQRAAWGLSQWN